MFVALHHPLDTALPPTAFLVNRQLLSFSLSLSLSLSFLSSPTARKLTNHAAYPGPSGQPQRQRILLWIVKAVKVPWISD